MSKELSKEFIGNVLEVISKEIGDTDDIRLLIHLAVLQKDEKRISEHLQRVMDSRDDYKIADIIQILLGADRPELAQRLVKEILGDDKKLESLQRIASTTKDGQDFQRLIDFIDVMTIGSFYRGRARKDAIKELVNANKFVWARLLNKRYSCYQADKIIKAALKIKNYDEAVKAAFEEDNGDLLLDIVCDLVKNDQLKYAYKISESIEKRLSFEKHYCTACAFAVIGFSSENKEYLQKACEASLKDIEWTRSKGIETRRDSLLILATVGILTGETQTVKIATQEALKLGWRSQEILNCILSMLNEYKRGIK